MSNSCIATTVCAIFFNTYNIQRRTSILTRAALTTHKLEWLEPWSKLAELELKCSNRELVYVGNTKVTQST